MKFAGWALGLGLLLLGGSIASADDVRLYVSAGWDGTYKNGRWAPVFVDVASRLPQMLNLEINAAHDENNSMTVRQRVSAGPLPTTYVLFVPLTQSAAGTSVRVTSDSGKTLAETAIADYSSSGTMGIGAGNLMIGESGQSTSRQLLQGQLNDMQLGAGWLDESRLPAVAIGYDALDILLLDAPDWSKIGLDQQTAIVDWIRAGGNLVVWPGDEAAPMADQPLSAVLPCTIGDVEAYDLDPSSLSAAGLDAHYARMTGRALQPRDQATPFDLNIFSASSGGGTQPVKGWRRQLGYGSIVMLPFNAGFIHFSGDPKFAKAFWRPILTAALPKLPPNFGENVNGNGTQYLSEYGNQRRDSAASGVMDLLGNVPGLGRFDFTYVAVVLLGLMVVVGPLDWFVLKRLGRQPWTWITTTGWIALVTVLAISLGYWLQSGDLYFRTLRVTDEADGNETAHIDVVGIYSPRSARYDISVAPDGWWEPLAMGSMGSRNMLNDIPFAQSHQGTTPLPVKVNIWNLKFLTGQTNAIMPGIIEAKLAINSGQLKGTITNHSSHPLKDMLVRGNETVWSIRDPIAAGATANILQDADSLKDIAKQLSGNGPGSPSAYYGQFGVLPESLAEPAQRLRYYGMACDLADNRSDQLDHALSENRALCVYGRIEDPEPAATLATPGALQKHWQIVRSMMSLPVKGQ